MPTYLPVDDGDDAEMVEEPVPQDKLFSQEALEVEQWKISIV